MGDLGAGFPRLIQAGMGVRISGWRLANATARLGALGVVSGVGLRHIVVEEIRAAEAVAIAAAREFPVLRYVEELLAFAPGGAWHSRAVPLDDPDPVRGALARRLSTIAAFVEVRRARAGHRGAVGVNVMWKCALTVLPTIYGAVLAGASALLCGAGVPIELPGILEHFRSGTDLVYRPLTGTGTHVRLEIEEDGTAELIRSMPDPAFFPILSNYAFPKRILDVWHREAGGVRPSAFVLEDHRAGGHNAPPRNKEAFTEKDDLETYFPRVLELGVPIFVAGSFPGGGSRSDLLEWTSRGAWGIQVGSRFALSDESGLRADLKELLLKRNVQEGSAIVTSPGLSPTGYPFKVAMLPGTLTDPEVYAARRRVCDKKYLVSSTFREQPDGSMKESYICPAMPGTQFVALGGDAAEAEGKVCLCNALLATAGIVVDEGEPPIVTLGLSGKMVSEPFAARSIVEEILTPEFVASKERELAG